MSTAPRQRSERGIDLPPAPPERLASRVRRRWRSLNAHPGLTYWILIRGLPLCVLYAGLYVACGLIVGWRTAYDVNVGITSPADTTTPMVAWPLSVAGWLLTPCIAGAVAGLILTSFVGSRRTNSIDELFTDGDGDE